MSDITLKEVEEAVVKVVELRPDAHYVVLVDESVDDGTADGIDRYFHREINSYPIIIRVQDDASIRILEVTKTEGN